MPRVSLTGAGNKKEVADSTPLPSLISHPNHREVQSTIDSRQQQEAAEPTDAKGFDDHTSEDFQEPKKIVVRPLCPSLPCPKALSFPSLPSVCMLLYPGGKLESNAQGPPSFRFAYCALFSNGRDVQLEASS